MLPPREREWRHEELLAGLKLTPGTQIGKLGRHAPEMLPWQELADMNPQIPQIKVEQFL